MKFSSKLELIIKLKYIYKFNDDTYFLLKINNNNDDKMILTLTYSI